MKRTVVATVLALGMMAPALATDYGGGNAEGLTKPVPNRGNTAGGPAHDLYPSNSAPVQGGRREGTSNGSVDPSSPAAPKTGHMSRGPN